MLARDIDNICVCYALSSYDFPQNNRTLVEKCDNIWTALFFPTDKILVRGQCEGLCMPCVNGDQLKRLLHISGKLRRKVCPPAVQTHCRKSLVQTREEGSGGHWGVSGRSASWSDKQAISIRCSLTLWVEVELPLQPRAGHTLTKSFNHISLNRRIKVSLLHTLTICNFHSVQEPQRMTDWFIKHYE